MGSLPGHSGNLKDMHICVKELVILNHMTGRTSGSHVWCPLIAQVEEISEQEGGMKWIMPILFICHPIVFLRSIRKRELFHVTIKESY